MATKSAFVIGNINEDFSQLIWEPETDIRTGVWAICLQKVVIRLGEPIAKEISFCVKTNLVEQNQRDKHGNLNVIKTCLGLFSCKGEVGEEIVLQNHDSQFFIITRPENEIIIQTENPLTKEKIKTHSTNTHKIGCYFVYKR